MGTGKPATEKRCLDASESFARMISAGSWWHGESIVHIEPFKFTPPSFKSNLKVKEIKDGVSREQAKANTTEDDPKIHDLNTSVEVNLRKQAGH